MVLLRQTALLLELNRTVAVRKGANAAEMFAATAVVERAATMGEMFVKPATVEV